VLEGAFDSGKIRSIGVSNYTVEDYKELEAAGIRVQPVVNQVRRQPRAPSLPHSGHPHEEQLPDSEPPLRKD
jgi:diketogulonate reductase-like aldo/keto reductase